MTIRPSEEIFVLLFSYVPEPKQPSSQLPMVDSRLVAVQWGILANRHLLLGCELDIFPSWLVSCHTSHSLVGIFYRCRANGCRQRSTGIWKAIWRLEILLPRVRIADSKFEHFAHEIFVVCIFVSPGLMWNIWKFENFPLYNIMRCFTAI